jgi:hypothetical protein
MTSVGRKPAYKPEMPSFRKMERRVARIVGLLLLLPTPPDFGTVWRGVVDSSGNTQSISPLFKMMVPHPGQVALGPIFTPRNIIDDELELECIVDDDEVVAVCCRIFTTSNGVTANAVMMDPMDPESSRGGSVDDDDDDDNSSSSWPLADDDDDGDVSLALLLLLQSLSLLRELLFAAVVLLCILFR